jgi:hypothetical protein
MSTKPSTGRVRSGYEFIKAHRDRHLCRFSCVSIPRNNILLKNGSVGL